MNLFLWITIVQIKHLCIYIYKKYPQIHLDKSISTLLILVLALLYDLFYFIWKKNWFIMKIKLNELCIIKKKTDPLFINFFKKDIFRKKKCMQYLNHLSLILIGCFQGRSYWLSTWLLIVHLRDLNCNSIYIHLNKK
jgi:hypothetical protein